MEAITTNIDQAPRRTVPDPACGAPPTSCAMRVSASAPPVTMQSRRTTGTNPIARVAVWHVIMMTTGGGLSHPFPIGMPTSWMTRRTAHVQPATRAHRAIHPRRWLRAAEQRPAASQHDARSSFRARLRNGTAVGKCPSGGQLAACETYHPRSLEPAV
jgi:hypothetical protein